MKFKLIRAEFLLALHECKYFRKRRIKYVILDQTFGLRFVETASHHWPTKKGKRMAPIEICVHMLYVEDYHLPFMAIGCNK